MEPSAAPWRALETTEEPQHVAPGDPVARGRPWLAICAVLLAVTVAGGSLLVATKPDPVIGVDGAPGPSGESTDSGGAPGGAAAELRGSSAPVADLVVEVGGAVQRPGVYHLAPGSRVGDALAAAGGYGSRVDAEAADRALNLAAPVTDGEEIHVPARGEAPASGSGSTAGGGATDGTGGTSGGANATGTGLVDLNRATAEQLDALPGIGPATAAKIIAARAEQPFRSVDDLTSRKVVGAAVLAKFRALVTVSR